MPTTTPNLGLRKPALTDAISVDQDLNANWDKVDAEFGAAAHDHLAKGGPVRRLMSGTLAARPATGAVGEVYYATDTRQLFFGTGTGWNEVLPGAAHASRHAAGGPDAVSHDTLADFDATKHRQLLTGTLAARPAAGVADRFYWATDTRQHFRDNGTAWEEVLPGAVHAGRHAPGGADSLETAYAGITHASRHAPGGADSLTTHYLTADREYLMWAGM